MAAYGAAAEQSINDFLVAAHLGTATALITLLLWLGPSISRPTPFFPTPALTHPSSPRACVRFFLQLSLDGSGARGQAYKGGSEGLTKKKKKRRKEEEEQENVGSP